jgi:hypothetical protein
MHLKQNPLRLVAIKEQLRRAHYAESEYAIFDAVRPTAGELAALVKKNVIAANCIPSRGRDAFRSGEVGHYLTLAAILADAIQKKHRHVLVLEDDAVLPEGFRLRVADTLRILPPQWDVYAFSWAKRGQNQGTPVGDRLVIPQHICAYLRQGAYIGTECLMFNGKSLQPILDKMFPMLLQTDKFLDLLKNICYIQLFVPKTPVTFQDPKFKSDIQIRVDKK